jgi:hypothetical protein
VHVQRGGMRGLIHANCSPAREREISDPPPSLGVRVRTGQTVFAHLSNERREVVAYQVQLVSTAAVCRVNG